MSYFESMRWYGLALDTARITIMKIDYFMHPQGKLVTDIQKALGTSLRRNMPLNELFERTKQEIIKLNEYDQSKFNENMYIPRFLIQPRKRASITVAQSMMKNDYNAASKYLSEANYIASVQFSLYAIYNLLFRNTIPIKLEEVLNTGLKKAGSKDWKSAANQLVNTLTKVYKMK
jgi:hypothetical protein